MYVEFDTLSDSARIWVYQSGRKFTEEEAKAISEVLLAFTTQWVAHGNPLKTSFKIFHDQFIILAADESFNEASGCSIDGALRTIQQINQQYDLGLLDRTNVGFLKDQILVIKQSELAKTLEQGIWQATTPTFNNVIGTKRELKANWIVPASDTWLKRYLTKITV